MNKRAGYVYMATTCSLVVLAPGRFAYGLILVIQMCLLMFFGTLFRSLIRVLKMEKMSSTIMLSFLIFFTIFFRQILILLMPVAALQLGFLMYLLTVSTFITAFLFDSDVLPLVEELKLNMFQVMLFSIFGLLFPLFRDIIGYGTITMISSKGVIEKVLFDKYDVSILSFVASIPGALILAAVILVFYTLLLKKVIIIKKAGLER